MLAAAVAIVLAGNAALAYFFGDQITGAMDSVSAKSDSKNMGLIYELPAVTTSYRTSKGNGTIQIRVGLEVQNSEKTEMMDKRLSDIVTKVAADLSRMQARDGSAHLDTEAIKQKLRNAVKALETRPPELMITEFDLPDGDIRETLDDIRHHRIGTNPFMCIIVTTWQPSEALVHQALGAGADDLLVQPASRGQLAKRIETLVFNRKPFVVTSNYIGPDRRTSPRSGTDAIETVDVPNVLQSKIMGEDNTNASQNMLDSAIAKVNLDKIIRNGSHIGYLTKKILSAYVEDNVDRPLIGLLQDLVSTGEDSIRRIRGTKYEAIQNLFETIIIVTRRLELAFNCPEGKDFKLLPELAMSIRLALKDSDKTSKAGQSNFSGYFKYAVSKGRRMTSLR